MRKHISLIKKYSVSLIVKSFLMTYIDIRAKNKKNVKLFCESFIPSNMCENLDYEICIQYKHDKMIGIVILCNVIYYDLSDKCLFYFYLYSNV